MSREEIAKILAEFVGKQLNLSEKRTDMLEALICHMEPDGYVDVSGAQFQRRYVPRVTMSVRTMKNLITKFKEMGLVSSTKHCARVTIRDDIFSAAKYMEKTPKKDGLSVVFAKTLSDETETVLVVKTSKLTN